MSDHHNIQTTGLHLIFSASRRRFGALFPLIKATSPARRNYAHAQKAEHGVPFVFADDAHTGAMPRMNRKPAAETARWIVRLARPSGAGADLLRHPSLTIRVTTAAANQRCASGINMLFALRTGGEPALRRRTAVAFHAWLPEERAGGAPARVISKDDT